MVGGQSWEVGLEEDAQEQADSCFFRAERATNSYHNNSEVKERPRKLLTNIVNAWHNSADQVNK